MSRSGLAIGAWIMTAATSCAPPVHQGGFDAPDPASRLYAVERAVEQNDHSAVPDIVALLDSDDPAVRLVAINALERLTGETFDYDATDPPEVRRQAMKRWLDYAADLERSPSSEQSTASDDSVDAAPASGSTAGPEPGSP